jgi:N-acetylglucosaminylphosphatidylinositol deacetylase
LTALPFGIRILGALFFRETPQIAVATELEHEHTHSEGGVDGKYAGKALVANTWHRYMMTRSAFASHQSQYTWDRYLYMILSRYVWFNDLIKVPSAET